jgi:hypothetical protein
MTIAFMVVAEEDVGISEYWALCAPNRYIENALLGQALRRHNLHNCAGLAETRLSRLIA